MKSKIRRYITLSAIILIWLLILKPEVFEIVSVVVILGIFFYFFNILVKKHKKIPWLLNFAGITGMILITFGGVILIPSISYLLFYPLTLIMEQMLIISIIFLASGIILMYFNYRFWKGKQRGIKYE